MPKYVYIGSRDTPFSDDNPTGNSSTVWRVNKDTLTDVTLFAMNSGEKIIGQIATDATYIYVTCRINLGAPNQDDARLVRILKSNFSTRNHLNLTGFYRPWSVLVDGGTLWLTATADDTNGWVAILKVDIATFSLIASVTLPDVPGTGTKMTSDQALMVQDTDNLYIPNLGFFAGVNSPIAKVNKSTLTTTWLQDNLFSGGGAMSVGSTYLFARSGSTKLVRILRSSFAIVDTVTFPANFVPNTFCLGQASDARVYIVGGDTSVSPLRGRLLGYNVSTMALEVNELMGPLVFGIISPTMVIWDSNYFFILARRSSGSILVRWIKPRPGT